MSEDFSNGKRGAVIKPDPNKVRITIRLDSDIVEHFKKQVLTAGGGNYQTHINEALREYINAHDKSLEDALRKVIREELELIREQYGDERRTEIIDLHQDLKIEDLINQEDVVVTLSHAGYAKAQPLSAYSAQRRGGKGKAAASVKEEDFIDKLFVANTHDMILCFSSKGKVYWLKVYELPQTSRTTRGKPIVNLLPLSNDERINAILPVHDFSEDQFIFMATASGIVKKTPLSHFSRPRASGIIAIELKDQDYLVNVDITDGEKNIMLVSDSGKAICFSEKSVRPMGRTACGVRGIKIASDQKVIALIITQRSEERRVGKECRSRWSPYH